METVTPLAYTEWVEFDRAYRYGNYFFVATLKDGRKVGFSADKVLITDTGDLMAISTSLYDDEANERKPIEQKVLLCLAQGQWISFYAANVSNGDPVGVEWVEPVKS